MSAAPITSLYAALLGILIIVLSTLVVRQRQQQKVGLGDGGNPALSQAIRVQANAVEYVPIALILLLIFELNGGNTTLTHVFGGVLLVSRIGHALGLSSDPGRTSGRVFGTLGTWLVILALSVFNVIGFFTFA